MMKYLHFLQTIIILHYNQPTLDGVKWPYTNIHLHVQCYTFIQLVFCKPY